MRRFDQLVRCELGSIRADKVQYSSHTQLLAAWRLGTTAHSHKISHEFPREDVDFQGRKNWSASWSFFVFFDPLKGRTQSKWSTGTQCARNGQLQSFSRSISSPSWNRSALTLSVMVKNSQVRGRSSCLCLVERPNDDTFFVVICYSLLLFAIEQWRNSWFTH